MALTGLVAANNLGDVVDIEKTWDNIGNNISATVFVPSPTLDLNFASNKSLVDNVSGQNLVTFSRASTGTFVGSNGLIQTAASGVPRFDHNPTTGESLGLLVEEARTNLFIYSQTLDTGWSTSNVTATINAGVALNGTTTATSFITSAISGNYKTVGQSPVLAASTNYCLSFYVKLLSGTGTATKCVMASTSDLISPAYASYGLRLDNLTETTDGNVPSTRGYIILPNGWIRLYMVFNTATQTNAFMAIRFGDSATASVASFLIWGAQLEAGAFPTSYIPTTSSAVTRAADIASISGSNFSRWHNQDQGSFFADSFARADVTTGTCVLETVNSISIGTPNGVSMIPRYPGGSNVNLAIALNGSYDGRNLDIILPSFPVAVRMIGGIQDNNTVLAANGSITSTINNRTIAKNVNYMRIGANRSGFNYMNATISRITYYPTRLSNITLRTLTVGGPVSSFPYSFSIKGRDILALKEVNKTSTRDFIFTKGLLSKAQPRLTTASQYTSSGVALRDAAMPKFAPVTTGNYLFSSGLTLSGATVQINGTNALSIATSPFTGSGATVPLLFAGLRPQANWRISETMASGVVASPESAIPITTGDFLLFMKAGQS